MQQVEGRWRSLRQWLQSGTFPAQGSELLSRLDRGEDAWVPDLQSSEESAEEGPVKPTLKRWPKAGMWWDLYRSPVKYNSTSESSEDEQESEAEEQKRPRGGRKLTILRRSILDIFKGNGCQGVKQTEASKKRPQPKKPPRAQLGKIKCSVTEVGDVAPYTAKKKASRREPQRTCPDCGQAFKTKASLLSHQKTHSGECPYKCSSCGERFTAKKAFASHQRGHAEERGYKHPSPRKHPKAYLRERPFKCSECGMCFQRKRTLTAHLNSHAAERPYRCPECEKAFTRKEHLDRHQKIHAREKEGSPPKGEREERAAIFPEKRPPAASEGTFLSGLGTDRQQGTPQNLYKCQFCGRCMRTKSLLVDHERIHREEMPYKCSQCQKSFLHKYSFLQHEATHWRKAACERPVRMNANYTPSPSRIFHTAENLSAVLTDGGKVTNAFNLSQHPRTPGGERVYKCQYCGKCLSGSGPLTNHKKLHRRGRSYKCPYCVKRFSRKDNLLQHKATHKKQKPVGRPRLKSSLSVSERIHTELQPHTDLRDGVVTRSVARSLSFSKHLKTYTEGKVYKCQYCGEHTRTKSLLVDHERIHRRKKKPYQCLECGKSFYQKNYLASHQRGHVRKKLSKRSNADRKVTTDNPRSLKRGNPHRRKAPWRCFKCGKRFDYKYHLTRHQKTHLAEKPFKCVCGKGFVEMWHLKRHEKTQLNKKCHKKLLRAEGKGAILNSANGVHPEEKNQGELPVNTEPPTASSTVERNILQDTEEENTQSLALAEASDMEILDVSEQGGTHVQVQVELSEQSQQNSLHNCREENVSVSQPVESKRKLSGKDRVIVRYMQDDHSKGQQVHQRHCSKRARLQGNKQKTACVKWQLRSQTMMLRRRSKQKVQLVGKQARSCFCQQEGRRRKPSLLQACKKVKTCSGPQSNQDTAASSSLLRSSPKGCEPAEHSFCLPSQTMFSTKSEPETIRSAALEMLAIAALKKGPREGLERESKGNSETGSCTSGEYNAVAIRGEEDTAASPNGNSDSGSSTAVNYDARDIGGQEDLPELSPLPERSPLQSCERTQAADELQNASLQNMEMWPRWNPSSPEACKEVETCSSPQKKQHTAASPKGNSDSGSCTSGEYDAVSIGGQEDLQELSPLPERSPLQSCERAQPADELQNASLQKMEMWPRWKRSSPEACKEVETCSSPQKKQHTAASPKGNSDSGSCTSGEYDAVSIGGQEDLPPLSPLPERSPLQSCKRAQPTDELQNASLQNMEMCPRWNPSSPEACKEVETCCGPQRNQHTAASPIGNSETGSCTSGEYDAVSIGGQEDLPELSPLPERSPLQSCERAQPADELQNASLQNMEMWPRWNPSSPEACKEVETCCGPQRNQHTATSSTLLRGSPKGCEPAELSFCLPSQTMFSTKSEPETIRSATLEMLTTAALKKGPREGLERESEGNSETGSCTSGEYDAVSIRGEEDTAASPKCNSDSGSSTAVNYDARDIGGQEDLPEWSPLPERSPLQSCERTQAADELQNASLQNMEMWPRWNPSSPEACKEVETFSGPQRNQHTAASPIGNSETGSCKSGEYDAVSIGGQEDLPPLSPLPERSPLQSCERAQAADELQNASLQNMEMWPRWNPSSPEACKEVETCSGPQRNQHTATSFSLLRGSPKDCEPGEWSFCLPPQATFSTKSEPENIRSAALEMLTTAALKKGPREGLEMESEGNSETGSCTSGEYDVVVHRWARRPATSCHPCLEEALCRVVKEPKLQMNSRMHLFRTWRCGQDGTPAPQRPARR
ncbi:finger 184-like [Podarcis lilfordi]|uniref:Finger 184-like n=1 Tax=Podarcis lilfordi TaxID=74358 RepID=A0AA35JZU9_9SAUR|nr:finger 184-like [Podarcis lilfordi]